MLGLLQLLRALRDGPTSNEAADALLSSLQRTLPAACVALYSKTTKSDTLHLQGHSGVAPDVVSLFTILPVGGAGVLADSIRTGTTLAGQLRDAASPHVAYLVERHPELSDCTCIASPLVHSGSAIGALAVLASAPTAITWKQQTHLGAMCDAVSLWGWSEWRLALEGDRHDMASVLTGRQKQVLALLADGYTNEKIGRQLGYSASTVKAEIARLLRISGARRRDALVELAARLGWIPDGSSRQP